MFRFGSKKDVNTEHKCTIRLLDDNEVLQCDLQKEHKGQYLLDFVCNALNLLERDYFGLRYVDSHKQRHWLDPTRSVLKQVKGLNPIVFCFRVKFYPPDPYRLKEEITRYQVFLQLRRDLLHGRLYCSQNDAAFLAAYIIQSEIGDYDPEEHMGNYVSEFKLLLKQTPRLEEKIAEIHQTQLRGQSPAVTEMNFLRKACLLDTYGVDPHPVKDHRGNPLYLGINHAGILTFQGSRKTHHFKWQDIQKITYEGKMFIIHLLFNEKKHLVGFKCPTQSSCHHMWRCAVEQRYFFTMNSSSEVPSVTTGGGLFSRGSKLRYSGRVEKEVVADMKNIKRDPPHFQRSFMRPPSLRRKANTLPCTPSSPEDVDHGFTSLRYLNHSTPISGPLNVDTEDFSLEDDTLRSPGINSLPSDILEPLDEEERNVTPPASLPSEIETRMSSRIGSVSSENVATLPAAPVPSQPCDSGTKYTETLCSPTPSVTDDFSPEYHHHPHTTCQQGNSVQSSLANAAEGSVSAPPQVKIPPRRSYASTRHGALPYHVSVVRAVILTCLFLLLFLSCLLVVIMESDSTLFSDLRKIPEMIMLRRDYYEPAKDYVFERMNKLFAN